MFVIIRNVDLCFVTSWDAQFNLDGPECFKGKFYGFDSRSTLAAKFKTYNEALDIVKFLNHRWDTYINLTIIYKGA